MDKEILIERSLKSLQKLPPKRINEVIDFIDFIPEKHKEEIVLQQGIHRIVEKSDAFSFLNEEEDLYSLNDLKEEYSMN